ncbi:cation transporter [Candidatus Bipolaricaulota bacterium]|nr:cation transporter [Candidatus Bipolaricaulota bacterium]
MNPKSPDKNFILLLTLATRVIIATAKLVVFFSTGLLFLLGEALNNVTDIVTVLVTMGSVKISEKGGDKEHPFGHRRLQSVASLVVAIVFIVVTSYQLIQESVLKLLNPSVITANLDWALYVLVGSFILNLIPLPYLIKYGRGREISLKTELFDTINDALSLVASMIGLGLIYFFQLNIGDPIATIIIALIISFDAVLLIKENINTLIGESPDEEFYDELRKVVLSHEKVLGVHDMIGEYIGPHAVHVDFDMELDPDTKLTKSDVIVREIKEKIDQDIEQNVYCSIHPCSHTGEERRVAKHI